MGSETKMLHMLFFPFMAQGHMPPMISMAKLFAAHGTRITILTTPVNAANIRPTIDDSIHLHIIPFPSADFGLPDGCENGSLVINDDQRIRFFRAVASLRQPFDASLQELRPDCVVTGMLLPWTYHVAAARGVPRLVFNGAGNFVACAFNAFDRCRHVLADKVESFILPGLPHQIEMLRTQVMDVKNLAGTSFEFLLEIINEAWELEPKNYGTLVNSFYELEPEYANQFRKEVGRAWNVGPAFLYKEVVNKTSRGGEQPASTNECLKWLDKKPAGSVVYMCFGSCSSFSVEQLREMALGLEASGHLFVWVVRDEGHRWVPDGFEKRTQGTGLVIRGWTPQVLILNHAAVGGFVTHCGWNSSLEGISAGLPMVTWPLNADQFYNEKFLVEVVMVGVAVGSKVYTFDAEARPVVKADAIEAAIKEVMGKGETAEERRMRVKMLAEMAKRAVDKGGSSLEEIHNLTQELMDLKKHAERILGTHLLS